ncbi:hypothetical protein FRC11_014741 [Ceratobasidium sp. 423]|nr:hypothetical protein FRC11_014741 [Ceratobasidium sp. 423]
MQDIEMQDADIPGMGLPGDFPPQVAYPIASDEPQAHPERGTPGPEGSNYRILDPENENEPSVPGSPPLIYDPKEQVWIEKYPVPTAGMPIRKATREEIAKYLIGEPGDIGELGDPDNFKIAEFLFQSGLSVQEKERFLNLKKFKGQMPWSSNYKMMQDIDKLPHPPKCEPHYYKMARNKGEQTEEFRYRNAVEVLQELLGVVSLRDEYHFQPEKVYTSQDKNNRQFSEAWWSKAMWDIQDKRGNFDQDVPLCEREATLQAITDHREQESAKFIDYGLHDQWPWWSLHTYLDIAMLHTPDLLHQLHKGVFKDHLFKWVKKIVGTGTFDKRYQLMLEHHGVRHFKHGVSKLSRTTGREAKEMMKVFLPVASDTNHQVFAATLALLKFTYLAHSSTLTETELDQMDQQLNIFHQHKDVFEEWLKSERGFHNLPKLHGLQHYTHAIWMLGTPDGYNTELPERLHIDITKTGFRASNKVDGTETEQMTIYIQRMEAIAKQQAHLTFWDRPVDFDEDDSEDDSVDRDTGKTLEHELDEDLGDGCVVEKVVNNEPTVQGQGEEAREQGPVVPNPLGMELQPYYPSPEIVSSKRRSGCVTIGYLATTHRAPDLVRNITAFLKTLNPPQPMVSLSSDTKIDIWNSARFYHERLPFKPLEPPKIDKLRAYPATINNLHRVRRVAHFDMALLLVYPDKVGIHRYRAARIRAIFELPKQLRHCYPHKLVYIEWLNQFSSSTQHDSEIYSTTLSLDQAQKPRSAVLPLAAVRLTCHLGPKFGTIDKETQITCHTDIFAVCKSFLLNQFGSYYLFDLLEHWARTSHAEQ